MTSTSKDSENAGDSTDLDARLLDHFAGKVVRKDLTKRLKEGANVPVYVLEYLLGMYCASADEQQIEAGMGRVKQVLAQNYVRPDEAEKITAKIRDAGSFKIIDKVTVRLNEKKDHFEAILSNLGIKNANIESRHVKDFEKLLGPVAVSCDAAPAAIFVQDKAQGARCSRAT